MFSYDPKDADGQLIPDGSYDAQVVDVEEKHSKAGDPMLKLNVRVWAGGKTTFISDFIVNPSTLWKLKAVMKAAGLEEQFKSGKFDPRLLVGKAFRVTVKTKKDTTGKYSDANVITKYSGVGEATGDTSFPPAGSHDPADDLNL